MPVLPRPAERKKVATVLKFCKKPDNEHSLYRQLHVCLSTMYLSLQVRKLTFAVDSNGSLSILTNVEELPDDGVIRCTAVHKEQIVMLKPRLCETPGIVHLLI